MIILNCVLIYFSLNEAFPFENIIGKKRLL